MAFRLLDLFSGVGGFSLGLERSGGFETVAFCEIDPFNRGVLARRWPAIPCFPNVETLSAAELAASGIGVDAICGGFPCQDISLAGKGEGLDGAASGLWFHFARLVGELRPRFVFVENVSGLLNRGMGEVLGGLAALGYGAVWDCIPASAVGAPHDRDRVWIVADAHDTGRLQQCWPLAIRAELAAAQRRGRWAAEPGVGRTSPRFPGRVDRLFALGNAVVPEIPEALGRAVMAIEKEAA
jgi:DNA (cytosine-5)-methyltransferase 1